MAPASTGYGAISLRLLLWTGGKPSARVFWALLGWCPTRFGIPRAEGAGSGTRYRMLFDAGSAKPRQSERHGSGGQVSPMTVGASFEQIMSDSGCVVLIVAGLGKLRQPLMARATLVALGRPGNLLGVRLLAIVEIVLGGLGLLVPSAVVLALVAALYVAFAAVVLYLGRSVGGVVSCGCFGHRDTTLSPAHALLNIAIAAVIAMRAIEGAAIGLPHLIRTHPVSGILYVVSLCVVTRLMLALLIELPRVSSIRSRETPMSGLSFASPVITRVEG